MPNITLTKTETSLLTDAAGREHGLMILPRTIKASTAERLLGKLVKSGATAREQDGTTDHHLTPAGYRAIGLKPPRRPRATASASEPAPAGKPGTKQTLILDLLARGEGASLDELIAATGWLPHTTRAALSRIRSGGQALVKSARPDGRTASTIPVVAFMLDPLKAGLVTSMARPGGNLTGITLDAGIEIWAKRSC